MHLSVGRRYCSTVGTKKYIFTKSVTAVDSRARRKFRLYDTTIAAGVKNDAAALEAKKYNFVTPTKQIEHPRTSAVLNQDDIPRSSEQRVGVPAAAATDSVKKYSFRSPKQTSLPKLNIKQAVSDLQPIQLAVIPRSNYAAALQNYSFHKRVSLLLDEDDCPHPYQVYKDITNTYDDCIFTTGDYTVLMAHCHVLLRCMESLEMSSDSGLAVGKSEPGQISISYTEESKQSRVAYNKCYSDMVDLWWELKDRSISKGEAIPMKAYSAAIRCCATLEDDMTAQKIFESHPDRLARCRNVSLITSLIWVFAEKGEMAKCVKLYDELFDGRLKRSTDTYEALLHCAFKTHEINTVLRIWRLLEKDRNTEPKASTWEMTIIGCLDTGFRHHAFLFYDKYKDIGCFPSEYVQKRMTEQYSKSISENLQPGSKLSNAVGRGAHLSYKMIIDFARVKSLRDITLPDHVPAMHSHYYAPLDGAGRGMDVDYQHMKPETRKGSIGTYTTHADPWHPKSGATVFTPPGLREPLRKYIGHFRARKSKRASDRASFEYHTGNFVRKGKDIHDYLGKKGRGPMTSESQTIGFNKRL